MLPSREAVIRAWRLTAFRDSDNPLDCDSELDAIVWIIACTLAVRRVLASGLYGIEAADPATMASVSLVLLAVAAIAITLPARRAARIDPTIALREE